MDKTPVGWLRTLFILFVALLIWAWLTKAWLIPNRFNIKMLSPNEKVFLELYDWDIDWDDKTEENISFEVYEENSPVVWIIDVNNEIIEDDAKKDDELINWSNEMKYYYDYQDDVELSIVMKAMWLRSTACSRIFCQSVADDWTYRNQKHYYWDIKDKKMILIPNVYFISRSDCTYYAELYDKNRLENKTNNQIENANNHEEETINQWWNVCPEWYTYWTYSNIIKWYTDVGYPPNRNRQNYEQNFENWKKDLKNKEVQEITFGPFEWCIPDNWKLETCTEADTYDYTFCTINMIPLNNKCPEWYSFIKAWVAWPYDLCQWNKDKIVDSGWYIHTDQIPLQDDCTFFVWMGILPADGHCDVKKIDDKN